MGLVQCNCPEDGLELLRPNAKTRISGTAFLMAVILVSCPAGAAVDYLREIKPVLKERCYACHGALKQQAGLRVDTAARLLAGGKEGPVVIAGKPDESRLIAKLTTHDVHERMPLEAAPLKPVQIAVLREWILAGAPLPSDEKGEDDPREHWSFQRIERPAVPPGPLPPVDAFLAAKHLEKTLQSQSEAERGLLGVIERHGRESVGVYLGNPSAHNLSAMTYNRTLLQALGTKQRFSASTVDQMPRQVAAAYVFGGAVTVPVPDLDRTDHLVILGANPYASNGSLCTAPDFPGRIEAMRARGGKLVVVDPRRSRTAEEADEWLAIARAPTRCCSLRWCT